MKKNIGILLLICLVFAACDTEYSKNKNNFISTNHVDPVDFPTPVDPAFWFEKIHVKLVERIGEVYSVDYIGPLGGEIADCQSVCDAINAKWGANMVNPEAGTGTHVANAEYLLIMIDKANNYTTNYKTSNYATKQIVDMAAVNAAIDRVHVSGGKFVAVSYNGSNRAADSADGINWTETILPRSASWNSVCYGDGKFVTVANNGKAAYSTNGINWTETTLPNSAVSICFGNDKFVAIARGSNKAAYSYDGINWYTATLPSSADWNSICFGNGKFVTVVFNNTNANSDQAAYSTDGINWTAATLPSSAGWNSVCFGNGKFVTVSYNISYREEYPNYETYSKAAYSTDGINWTETTMPSTSGWNSVCYDNGKFVTVAGGGTISNRTAYSINGINWTGATMLSSASWRSVCYGNGNFVAVSTSGNKAAYSTDGINWTETTMPNSADWYSVCYGGN